MSSFRISVISPSFSGGGAEEVAKRWADGLRALGNEVDEVCLSQLTDVDSSKSQSLFFRLFPKFLVQVFLLRSKLGHCQNQVVISLLPLTNLKVWLSTLFLHSKPILIFSEHSIPSQLIEFQSRKNRILTPFAWSIYRYADLVLAPSHAAAANLIGVSSTKRGRVKVIQNPAILEVLPRISKHINQGFKDSRTDTVRLIVAGRLSIEKNPILSISVAEILRHNFSQSVEIVYLGEGPLEADLVNHANLLNISITIHAWSSNWTHLISSNTVLLHCSSSEGFGNVILNAANHGIPTVAYSGALGVADAVIPGITGYLAISYSAEDFAEGIMKVKDLKIPPIENWLTLFTQEQVALRIQKLIEEISSQRNLRNG